MIDGQRHESRKPRPVYRLAVTTTHTLVDLNTLFIPGEGSSPGVFLLAKQAATLRFIVHLAAVERPSAMPQFLSSFLAVLTRFASAERGKRF